jgi:hypothetical protein
MLRERLQRRPRVLYDLVKAVALSPQPGALNLAAEAYAMLEQMLPQLVQDAVNRLNELDPLLKSREEARQALGGWATLT